MPFYRTQTQLAAARERKAVDKETDRCVAIIQAFAQQGWKCAAIDIINAIRRTSPGEGGG